MPIEYVSFSDESYTTAVRFRGICAVSFPRDRLDFIEDEIKRILHESGVEDEFKWQKTRNAKYRLCADKLFRFAIKQITESAMRVDVLVWDTHDRRHDVAARDDEANYERMFFHLLKNVMKKRERNSLWHIFPDEKLGIDWNTIEDCLGNFGQRIDAMPHALIRDLFTDPFYQIKTFKQVASSASVSVQLADFFAGIGVFAREKSQKYFQWIDDGPGMLSLFVTKKDAPSGADRERFRLIHDLNRLCKEHRLGVSLESRRYLWTPEPRNPLNFWHYEPKHEKDRAPTRSFGAVGS